MGGYKVVDMWECEFMKTRSLTWSDVKGNKKKYYHAIPLNPRVALFGGRTSPCCLFKECDENEKIYYEDFTLLYPFVQIYECFPVGHPTVYMGDECNVLDIKEV